MTVFAMLFAISLVGITAITVLMLHEKKGSVETLNKLKTIQEQNESLIKELESDKEKLSELKALYAIQQDELAKAHSQARQQIQMLIDETSIKDIMSNKVVTLNENELFIEVPRKMDEHSIRHLPVVNDENQLVGLMSQRMLYKISSPRKLMNGEWHYDEEMLSGIILKKVMETDVYALPPDKSIGKALVGMVEGKRGSIPIVDENNLVVGIVTRRDILKVAVGLYQGRDVKK